MQDKKSKDKILEEERMRFIAFIAHEIRTPLSGILSFSELMDKPDLPVEKMKIYSDIINKSANRLMILLNDLIEISKLKSSEGKIIRDTMDLNLFLEELVSHFIIQSDLVGVDFKVTYGLDHNAAQVYTDALKLSVILNNLIGNAVKFTKKGCIYIDYLQKGDFLEFHIKDTGVGISREDQKSVFVPFYQAKTDAKINSSGLGLAITKNLVELLGGKIWFESEPGVGSTFTFTIPYEKFELPISIEDIK